MANNYEVNYNDERFQKVEADKNTALNQVDQTYGDMINKSDEYYKAQQNEAERWGKEQADLQDKQTEFTLEKIEQQKEQAQKDYLKEQSGAYVDWQKQSAQHGVNAEKMASAGLAGSGYSESSQVSMYNTYQNRVMVARESINQAIISYNNDMTAAKLQNSVSKAEIAAQTLQKKMEIALQGFQYKNTLLTEQANKKLEVENMHYSRWQDVLNQINTENSLAEQIRQYNESLALQKAQFEEDKRQFNALHSGTKNTTVQSTKTTGGSYYTSNKGAYGTHTSSTKSNQASADYMDLGYGPRTDAGIAELISQGKVTAQKNENGSVTLTRTDSTTQAQNILDKYSRLNKLLLK